jgi:hypothetical protein
MLKKLNFLKTLLGYHKKIRHTEQYTERQLLLQAKNHLLLLNQNPNIADWEFKVFSRATEDGVIQYLIKHVDVPAKRFIEFGVEDYTESNTRFLLQNNNWEGLVIDGSKKAVDYIKKAEWSSFHHLFSECAFITAENINELFLKNGFEGDLGILSIDIDGNDYWVWQAITVVNPVIVVVEYNSVLGSEKAITVPYNPSFVRSGQLHNNLFWGASLAALAHLGNKKGYALVHCDSFGANAYFVRRDKLGSLKEKSVEEAFVLSKFRDSRDENNQLNFISHNERYHQALKGNWIDVTQ